MAAGVGGSAPGIEAGWGVPGQKGVVCQDFAWENWLMKWLYPLQPASERFPKSHLAEVPGQGDLRQADVLNLLDEVLNRPEVPCSDGGAHLYANCS